VRPDLSVIFGALGASEPIAAVVTGIGGEPNTLYPTTVLEVGAYNEPWPESPGINSVTKMRRRFGLILAEIGNPTEIKLGTEIALTGGDTFSVEATDFIDDERAIVLARRVA
jgi:hypothetical protein